MGNVPRAGVGSSNFSYPISWDSRDSSGTIVPNGIYTMMVSASDNNGVRDSFLETFPVDIMRFMNLSATGITATASQATISYDINAAIQNALAKAKWDAKKALDYGLVSEVVPQPELMNAARAMAERVLALGPIAVRLAKQALNASATMPLPAGLAFESLVQAITYETNDKNEGASAFLEKRKPSFKGD